MKTKFYNKWDLVAMILAIIILIINFIFIMQGVIPVAGPPVEDWGLFLGFLGLALIPFVFILVDFAKIEGKYPNTVCFWGTVIIVFACLIISVGDIVFHIP